MAAKGYAAAADVAAFLGRTFTTAQNTQAALLIATAEEFIDRECGRAWLTGTIIAEQYYAPFALNPPSFRTQPTAGYVPIGADIRTANTPVDTIITVRGYGWWNADPVVLVLNTDYEVRSLTQGLIRLIAPTQWYKIQIDYTPTNMVPQEIWLATVQIVALWMQPNLNPDSFGVDSFQLPDLKVVYSKGISPFGIPPQIQALLNNNRFRTIA